VADTLVIEATNLWKRYGEVEALRGLDLRIPAGCICGFLGRNGAGKTTAIKVLLGMTRPTSGTARVFGHAADEADASLAIRCRTGFVSDDKELYGYMTVSEIIRFTAAFYPGWRRDLERGYLQRFALPAGRKVKTLSRGTRSKLALLLALCRSADLLVLDEPTSGLDPAMSDEVLQTLVGAAAEGATVFFSSHHIAEVEQVADRVAVIDKGRLVIGGAVDDLKERFCRVQFLVDRDAPEPAFRTPGVVRVRRDGRVLSVLSNAGTGPIADEGRALGLSCVDVVPVTLKEIFLETVDAED
jgi:ABC-2 type transport system ATP-binding protein